MENETCVDITLNLFNVTASMFRVKSHEIRHKIYVERFLHSFFMNITKRSSSLRVEWKMRKQFKMVEFKILILLIS